MGILPMSARSRVPPMAGCHLSSSAPFLCVLRGFARDLPCPPAADRPTPIFRAGNAEDAETETAAGASFCVLAELCGFIFQCGAILRVRRVFAAGEAYAGLSLEKGCGCIWGADNSNSNAAPPWRGCPGGVPPPEEGREGPSLWRTGRGGKMLPSQPARCRRYKHGYPSPEVGPRGGHRGGEGPGCTELRPRWKPREVSHAPRTQPYPGESRGCQAGADAVAFHRGRKGRMF
jgi:hypothetical protein